MGNPAKGDTAPPNAEICTDQPKVGQRGPQWLDQKPELAGQDRFRLNEGRDGADRRSNWAYRFNHGPLAEDLNAKVVGGNLKLVPHAQWSETFTVTAHRETGYESGFDGFHIGNVAVTNKDGQSKVGSITYPVPESPIPKA